MTLHDPVDHLPRGEADDVRCLFRPNSRPETSIRRAIPRERSRALSLLFKNHSPRRREILFHWAREQFRKTPDVFQGLHVAERGGIVRGAIWGTPVPGRQMSVWPPSLASGETETTRTDLLRSLDGHIEKSDAHVAFTTIRSGQYAERKAVSSNDYRYIADIAYMACCLMEARAQASESELNFQRYNPTDAGRMKDVLHRCSEQSLDCPALRGVRQVDDILEGHFNKENYRPSHWKFVRHEGQDVGCLLLSQHQHQAVFDVVYLGLVPEVRRRGWGVRMIRHAQDVARLEGAQRLMLTCDVNNPPALNTYRRTGFHEIDRWSTFLKVFPQMH